MSEIFQIALSLAYVIIYHKKSKKMILFQEAPAETFDIKFVDDLNEKIESEEIVLPQNEGEMIEGTFGTFILLIYAGKHTITILVNNNQPNSFSRESLHAFSTEFEESWKSELKELYFDYKGDIGVFHKESKIRKAVPNLISDMFNFKLTKPHRIGFPQEKLSKLGEAIWTLAQDLAATSGHIMIKELLSVAQDKFTNHKEEVSKLIFDFIKNGLFSPIEL